VLAWLSQLFDTKTVTGETAEKYVSIVNAAYATTGLAPPVNPYGSYRLYHDMKVALAGFTRAHLKNG
jgi:hypothetical protein